MSERDRVALWAVVSSDEQNNPNCTSVQMQLERGRHDAERAGDLVVAVLQPADETGCSRFYDTIEHMCRAYPPYRRLVELITTRAVTKVVALNYSRYWRASTLATQLIALAEQHGVWLYSVEEPYDRAIWQDNAWLQMIHITMPEVQIRKLASDRRNGMQKRAERGLPVCSIAPLGYRMEGRGKDRQLMPDDRKRATIVLLMEWRAAGWGCSRAERESARLGLTGANGQPLSASAIYRIWHNPTYAGYIQSRIWPRRPKTPRRGRPIVVTGRGKHEPLISEELWQKVQRVNASQASDYALAGRPPHLFTGLTRCGVCGTRMRYHRHCDSPLRHSLACTDWQHCNNGCSVRWLRRSILAWLREALADPDAWLRSQEDADGATEHEQRRAALNAEVASIERKRANLLAAIEDAPTGADRTLFVERYDALNLRHAQCTAELAGLERQDTRTRSIRERLITWGEAADRLDTWPDAELRSCLLQLVDHIVIVRGQPPRIVLASANVPD